MKKFAKITDGVLTTTCAAEEDTELIAQIMADGFKPYYGDARQPEVGQFQLARAAYIEEPDRILLRWVIVENSPEKIAAEIARLQSELTATDYQMIKSYEYALAGEEPPYDVAAIHDERQRIRDRIRELESLTTES